MRAQIETGGTPELDADFCYDNYAAAKVEEGMLVKQLEPRRKSCASRDSNPPSHAAARQAPDSED